MHSSVLAKRGRHKVADVEMSLAGMLVGIPEYRPVASTNWSIGAANCNENLEVIEGQEFLFSISANERSKKGC